MYPRHQPFRPPTTHIWIFSQGGGFGLLCRCLNPEDFACPALRNKPTPTRSPYIRASRSVMRLRTTPSQARKMAACGSNSHRPRLREMAKCFPNKIGLHCRSNSHDEPSTFDLSILCGLAKLTTIWLSLPRSD